MGQERRISEGPAAPLRHAPAETGADLRSLARAWAALPQVSDLCASADGAWGFWCSSGLGEVQDVFAAPLGAPGAVEQLTFGSDHFGIRDVSADGQVLILAQSRNASGHDHLLLLDRRVGNRLHLLTPKQDNHRLTGGQLTRDGKAVIFATDYDYARQVPVDQGLVWRQDLTTGHRLCLARLPRPISRPPRLSPSGQRILLNVCTRTEGSGQIWVMNADGSGLREVFAMGETNDSRGDWLDEDRIAVVTDRMGRDEVGIFTLSAGTTQWLGGEPQVLPDRVVIGGKGGFACIAHRRGQAHALVFDAAGARVLPNLSGRRTLVPQAGLPNGGWLALAYDGDAPDAVVQVAPDGLCRGLTPRPASSRRHRAPLDFAWTSPDGRPVQGWLHEPEAPSRGLIVHLHDGPAAHSEDRASAEIGFWVQLGYTVLDANCRGSTGFGFAWRRAIAAEAGRDREQDDLRAGIEAVIQRGQAPGRVAVMGTGHGAISSWKALLRAPDLVTAALPVCGACGPADGVGSLAQIFRIRGHVLLILGAPDTLCERELQQGAVRTLTEAGPAHEVLVFDNEGHGIRRRANVETLLMRAALFVERALAAGPR